MEINRKLNFVLPVERDDGSTCYVHAQPIGHQVFKENYLVIAQSFSFLYSQGIAVYGGPKIAAMLIRDVAEKLGIGERVERSLLAEIRRLANVAIPTSGGWKEIPLEDAIKEKEISSEDAEDVEGVLCFFTLASSMHSKKDLPGILSTLVGLWSGQITSLMLTAYLASLKTSTQAAPIGETVSPLSIPH